MLLAFVIPVFIVIQKQKSAKKKLVQQLTDIEKQNNLKISEREVWGNKVIGLDDNKKVAIFIIRNDNNNVVTTVNLREISGSRPERSVVSIEGENNVQAVNAVRIRFAFKDKNKRDSVFTLFDEETDQTINDEIYLANTWSERFNKAIKG